MELILLNYRLTPWVWVNDTWARSFGPLVAVSADRQASRF